jgi:hypothetical protein
VPEGRRAYRRRLQIGVGDLEGHADGEREIGEVAMPDMGQTASQASVQKTTAVASQPAAGA